MASELAGPFLERIATRWRDSRSSAPLEISTDALGKAKIASDPALSQAVWSLLENAADASGGPITLQGRADAEMVSFAVLDRGPGFSEATVARAGQLYQSTKGPGHGLGLFLASNVARQLGGRLDIANRNGGGAEVTLFLPLVTGSHCA
jgi:two-component system sensor histidine kinase RegB